MYALSPPLSYVIAQAGLEPRDQVTHMHRVSRTDRIRMGCIVRLNVNMDVDFKHGLVLMSYVLFWPLASGCS